MKIAIDIREAAGQKTGKGWYTFVMVKNILKMDPGNEYILYTQAFNPKFEKYAHVTQQVIPTKGLRWHWKVLRDFKVTKPDVFWAPTSYIIPALAPKTVKTIITIHDLITFIFSDGHNKKAVLLERLTVPRAVRKASKILVVSNNTKRDLQQQFGTSSDKILVTPCGASKIFKPITDPKILKAHREKFDLPQRFILGVGTLSPRKNFTRLIEAYEQIAPRHPDVHLVIVGDKGWKFEHILKEASQSRDRIHLSGYLEGEEVAVLYNLAEMFVFPSLYEGFGMPPLEAMACGCPVITSNTSSLPEVVGDAALQVDPYSVDEIAQAMDRLLTRPKLNRTLIERGFKRAQTFRWEKSARKVLEAFREMNRV